MECLYRTAIRPAILSVLAFLLITLSTPFNSAQQTQETTAQSSSPLHLVDIVTLTVTVTNKRRNYVKGLTHLNFTVSDGKQEQQIKAFNAGDVPLSVGILIDASGSVRQHHLKLVRDALQRFFELSNASNEYFLIGFNNSPALLHDWTRDTESILKQIDAIKASRNTALYDACSMGVDKVLTGRERKHVLILVSDGQDNNSSRHFTDIRRLFESTDVLLYSFGIESENDSSSSSLGLEGRAILDELSSTTGGVAFFTDGSKQTDAAFETLAIELRNQYSIGFVPTTMDGKRRSLKVRVTPPLNAPRDMQSLTVRYRQSFYAKRTQP